MKRSQENGKKLPKTPNLDTKWPKNGWPDFFWAWCLNKKCREYSNLLKYEISAKNNEAISRNRRKTVKNPYFGDKMLNNLDTHFFFINRASSLLYTCNKQTSCKKAKKSYGRKYENFCCRLTDRLTEAILKDQSVGPKNERKMTRMTGNLRFYRNRDAAESVSKFDISKLKDFHNAV